MFLVCSCWSCLGRFQNLQEVNRLTGGSGPLETTLKFYSPVPFPVRPLLPECGCPVTNQPSAPPTIPSILIHSDHSPNYSCVVELHHPNGKCPASLNLIYLPKDTVTMHFSDSFWFGALKRLISYSKTDCKNDAHCCQGHPRRAPVGGDPLLLVLNSFLADEYDSMRCQLLDMPEPHATSNMDLNQMWWHIPSFRTWVLGQVD